MDISNRKEVLICKEDVEALKKTLKKGDVLRVERVFEEEEIHKRLQIPRMIETVVVRKYPHLVEVVSNGPALPRQTITYTEILMGMIEEIKRSIK